MVMCILSSFSSPHAILTYGSVWRETPSPGGPVVLQQSRGINWWAAAAGQTQVAQGRFWSFLGHCCSADLFPLFRRKLAVFGVGCCLTSQTGRQDRRLD